MIRNFNFKNAEKFRLFQKAVQYQTDLMIDVSFFETN
jgi:hypothetical protein